jgi:tetratricopeptide (TPR) repeat protein
VFAVCRDRLDEELGVRPGPELARAQERVLRQEDLPAPAGRPHPDVPRQLPAAVSGFVGREAEMTMLAGLLDQAAPADRAVLISAIGGTAGVGKTALAVHWAHQVADRFPGGQLYVNLRGYDPEQPVSAADALAGFLRALGVPGPGIPPGADERAALYRSLLAQRRVLVLLDNAGSVEQVRPLLPGAAACVVVVTSRDALAGLVARDGARRLELDLLPPGEAAGLLRELIGERAAADPAATAELASLCARLPLALRVAAEHVIARAAIPLAGLVAELAGLPRRLDMLDTLSDPHTGVRAVFSWSCHSLGAAAARAYRLAGLHPGPDLDVYAAAALTGLPLGQAGQLMDQLACAYLVQVSAAGRYSMHDLLRGYARELAAAQDSEQEQRAALSRLFGHYLSTAFAAVLTLYPAEADRLPAVAASAGPGVAAAPVGDPAAALAWLDAQRPCLVMSMAYLTEHGWPDLATQLARTLYRYLYAGSHVREGVTVLGQACRAAREAGDPGAEAAVLASLAGFRGLQGRYAQATEHLEQALGLARAAGEQITQARALSTLGVVSLWMGHYEQAGLQASQALEAWRELGNRLGQARALNVLGCVELHHGRYEQGARHLTAALALCRETGTRFDEAIVLGDLGLLELRRDRYEQAADYLDLAVILARSIGTPDAEAPAMLNLGLLELRRGRLEQAGHHLHAALAMSRQNGVRHGEAETLAALGELALRQGDSRRAADFGQQALALAREIGDRAVEATALTLTSDALLAVGDPAMADHRPARGS